MPLRVSALQGRIDECRHLHDATEFVAGVYVVTIAWRGTASLTNNNVSACGTAGGNYGAGNEFRRIMQVPTFIDPTL